MMVYELCAMLLQANHHGSVPMDVWPCQHGLAFWVQMNTDGVQPRFNILRVISPLANAATESSTTSFLDETETLSAYCFYSNGE